nr:hypothetical protein CFP56_43429 [Quercus suber]
MSSLTLISSLLCPLRGRDLINKTPSNTDLLPRYQMGKNTTSNSEANKTRALWGDPSWDAVKGTIDASDDWWDMKLKEVPKTSKFRHKGPQNLQQLERMFRDVTATGAEFM